MATLYVDNIPEDLYEALRAQAKAHRMSISAEVLTLLERNVPTAAELARRRELVSKAAKLRRRKSPGTGPFPSTGQMQREDRER